MVKVARGKSPQRVQVSVLEMSAGRLCAVIMGPPGAGKGTISSKIVQTFKLAHLSSGDILRRHTAEQTALGKEAKGFLDSGRLVPDATMVELMLAEARKAQGRWLLDGFPRTVPQAKSLLEKEPLDSVINLDVPFATIIDRIRGRWVHLPSGRVYNDSYNPPRQPGVDDVTGDPLTHRHDDRPEVVAERLKLYEEQTKPVLEFYKQLGLLETFSGTESDVIWPQVERFIETL